MGLATYVLGRIANAIMVILIATIICSMVFNALMEINVTQRISMMVEEELQKASGRGGLEGMLDYVRFHASDMREFNIVVEVKNKQYYCSDIFTNNTLLSKLKEENVDLEGVARDCIEKYVIEREKHVWGLDKPYVLRVLLYTYKTITFNLGRPLGDYKQFGEYDSTFSLLIQAMARSMMLFTIAYAINMTIAIYLGLNMARNTGGLLDRVVSIAGMTAHSFPLYWVGLLMILIFSAKLNIFPSRAWESPPDIIASNTLQLAWWWGYHLTLPILTIVLIAVGPTAYVVRNMVLNVMQEDFVQVARAKGLPEKYVLYKHILRAASPPIVTSILLGLVNTFFGAIISERVFQWPGMGTLYWLSITSGDIVVLMGLNYMFILLFVSIKILLDLIYCALDPRIRTEKGG